MTGMEALQATGPSKITVTEMYYDNDVGVAAFWPDGARHAVELRSYREYGLTREAAVDDGARKLTEWRGAQLAQRSVDSQQ